MRPVFSDDFEISLNSQNYSQDLLDNGSDVISEYSLDDGSDALSEYISDSSSEKTSYNLPPISDEQRLIVENIGERNVIVDAVAGSGKTTTVLHIGKKYPDHRILLLTYNRKLRIETECRAKSINLQNLCVHTYHSFAWRNISYDCATDAGIIKFVESGNNLKAVEFDIIIVDECQDMKLIYYRLVEKIIAANKIVPRLCVCGDRYQAIYKYTGADPRFITLADLIFTTKMPWIKLSLSTSYRITRQMANFINFCVLKQSRLHAVKDGPSVNYIIHYAYDPYIVLDYLMTALLTSSPEQIFLLAPTVRPGPNNSLRILANALSRSDIPIYVPTCDDEKLDEKVMRHKIVFSSFHQSKGLEREHVFVLNFDASYYMFYNKEDDSTLCSNALYVALTRATTSLTIFQDSKTGKMSFIDPDTVKKYAEVVGEIHCKHNDISNKEKPINVTDLVNHLPSETITECLSLISPSIVKSGTKMKIKLTTDQLINGKTLRENVSDINGTAIPAFYEYITTGQMSICEDETINDSLNVSNLLRITNEYLAKRRDIIFKTKQITNYDWLTEKQLKRAADRLSTVFSPERTFAFETLVSREIFGKTVVGYIDMIELKEPECVIEIKTVSQIKPEHYLQLAIYAFLYPNNNINAQLYNILEDKLVEISTSSFVLEEVVRLLICAKYHTVNNKSDQEFLASIGAMTTKNRCQICVENDWI